MNQFKHTAHGAGMTSGKYAALLSAVIQTPLLGDSHVKPLPIVPAPYPRTVRVVDEGTWPVSSSILCWHCCHPFASQPLPMPTHYNERLDMFRITGTFCSWACMKAYNMDSRSYMRHVNATIITLCRKRCTGKVEAVHPAPPRLALQAFGGDMTIEEFRATNKNMMVLPPRMIMHRPVIEEIPARMRERPSAQQLQDTVPSKMPPPRTTCCDCAGPSPSPRTTC